MPKTAFKAVCFDWGNTIEVGTPRIVNTLQHIWRKIAPDVKAPVILNAHQRAWIQLARMVPGKNDLRDMSEFRQMIYARQAELVANYLKITPDIPDWPWVMNVFFNEHYFKNRTWSILRSHARLLRKLRTANIPMAVIANDEDPAELQKLISDLGLTGFFEFELSSSTFGYPKPHPKIFLAALNRLDLRADEVLFVGDDYHNDYWGPKQVGMYPLLFDPQRLHSRIRYIKRIERLEDILDYVLPD